MLILAAQTWHNGRMRTIAILIVTLGLALAQSLVVPTQVRAGTAVPIRAEGLEPGAYPIDIEGPGGIQVVTLVTTENGGILDWVPEEPGEYLLRLYLSAEKTLNTRLQVMAPPPQVNLEEGGIRIGERFWPLPEANWLDPLVTTDAVLLAARKGPLVLRYPLGEGQVSAYYPRRPLAGLLAGPVVVFADGGQERLEEMRRDQPYQGGWVSLDALKKINEFWKKNYGGRLPAEPDGYRPYWVYWSFDPAELTAADLEAWGRDLLARGHHPELVWGEGARYWTDAWQAAALQQESDGLTWALLKYAPLHPDSREFFEARAAALERSGRDAEALRLRAAFAQTASFRPLVTASGARNAFWSLLLAYVALFLILYVRYLPAQRRGLAEFGGLLGSWSRNPLRRLRHLLPAYATWGERLLAFLIFAAALLSLFFWATATRFEGAVDRPLLDRATLAGNETLSDWPASPGLEALKAYRLAGEDPKRAKSLLVAERLPLAFAQLLDYRLNGNEKSLLRAYEIESAYVPVQEELGLGADAWSQVYEDAGVDRRGVPRMRDLCRVYFWGSLTGLASNPSAPLLALGLRDAVWAYAVMVLLALWLLLHLWVLLLPRPRGAIRSRSWLARFFELLVPGSNSFGKGWGVVLLLAAAYGAISVYQGHAVNGAVLLIAAYLVHFFLWLEEVRS